jgi:hypothetical protein
MSKYLPIPEDSLEMMLGGRSSFDEESNIIAGIVSTYVRLREEIGSKYSKRTKSEQFLQTVMMTIIRVSANFSDELV